MPWTPICQSWGWEAGSNCDNNETWTCSSGISSLVIGRNRLSRDALPSVSLCSYLAIAYSQRTLPTGSGVKVPKQPRNRPLHFHDTNVALYWIRSDLSTILLVQIAIWGALPHPDDCAEHWNNRLRGGLTLRIFDQGATH
jgi:hypothetical protein